MAVLAAPVQQPDQVRERERIVRGHRELDVAVVAFTSHPALTARAADPEETVWTHPLVPETALDEVAQRILQLALVYPADRQLLDLLLREHGHVDFVDERVHALHVNEVEVL